MKEDEIDETCSILQIGAVSRRRRCAFHDITPRSQLSLHAPFRQFATVSQTHLPICVTGRPVAPPR